ncbi:putative receptor protein kinase ZmPK1, partial [Mucuna pruriens]
MAFSFSLFFLLLLFPFQCSSSLSALNQGSSLSVEKYADDVIVSSNKMFCAGFFQVGLNAFYFAIWFNDPHSHNNTTVVWMANREQPVNGRLSKLSLLNTGNIVLLDAAQITTWSSNTVSQIPVKLYLQDDGNLVLRDRQQTILWQSFDFPTDTLLPGQPLTRYTQLVSSRSMTNHSSGFYKLLFDDDNVLRLIYDGPDVSSQYWPLPWLLVWQTGRFNYNSSRHAVLNSLGNFTSSDNYTFSTNDHGMVMPRRLTLDSDGNVRVYSRKALKKWYVSWQVIPDTCTIHGVCGVNSTCNYDPKTGRRCSCLPGYRVKNHSDWSYGCEPKFDLTCNGNESTFLEMQGVEFYGYDSNYVPNSTYMHCVNLCLQDCKCIGFQYRYDGDKGYSSCFTKLQLLNGRRSPNFTGKFYLRLPKSNNFSGEESVNAYDHFCPVQLPRDYVRKLENRLVKFFLWLATAVGALEMVCLLMIWGFLIRTRQKTGADQQGYHLAAVGFRKY